jgi:hypothetical protein
LSNSCFVVALLAMSCLWRAKSRFSPDRACAGLIHLGLNLLDIEPGEQIARFSPSARCGGVFENATADLRLDLARCLDRTVPTTSSKACIVWVVIFCVCTATAGRSSGAEA